MRLSPRMERIADLVPENSIVADIGTDHGYIPRHLIDSEKSKYVIATDISRGSLKKTEDYVLEENLQESIDCRLGNGLEPIREYEVDTVVIAGMGGLLIAQILEESLKKSRTFNRFILQPMVGAKELRVFLHEKGFAIKDEELVREGDKYYEIIVAESGLQAFDKEIDYEISPILRRKEDRLWMDMVNERLRASENIANSLKGNPGEKGQARLEELETVIRQYKEVL